jgi:hypothetical protein
LDRNPGPTPVTIPMEYLFSTAATKPVQVARPPLVELTKTRAATVRQTPTIGKTGCSGCSLNPVPGRMASSIDQSAHQPKRVSVRFPPAHVGLATQQPRARTVRQTPTIGKTACLGCSQDPLPGRIASSIDQSAHQPKRVSVRFPPAHINLATQQPRARTVRQTPTLGKIGCVGYCPDPAPVTTKSNRHHDNPAPNLSDKPRQQAKQAVWVARRIRSPVTSPAQSTNQPISRNALAFGFRQHTSAWQPRNPAPQPSDKPNNR